MICMKVKTISQKTPIFVISDAFYCGDCKCKISCPVIFLFSKFI